MDYKKELITILEQVGPQRIRRPIYDNKNQLLAPGVAYDRDGHPDDLSLINFSGKTVVDLGCNFGFYSFLARQKGAAHVLGVDLDKPVIKGCEILRDYQGIKGVDFLCTDFTDPSFSGIFDITLLIDFFGKGNITQGIKRFLDTTERMTREVMIISARNHYRIEKHFNGQIDTLIDLYTKEYIRNNKFYLIEYISDYLTPGWELSILSPPDHDIGSKKTLYFQRKS